MASIASREIVVGGATNRLSWGFCHFPAFGFSFRNSSEFQDKAGDNDPRTIVAISKGALNVRLSHDDVTNIGE
jgi:hypothetical protein